MIAQPSPGGAISTIATFTQANTTTTTTTVALKMLSFFRKSSSKSPSIMTGPNTSETTLVSTSLSTTPLSTTNSSSKSNNSFMSEPGKFTPTQPFLGSNNKSVVQERLGTAQRMPS
ncbi:uncharacterized protein UBRO2_03069 [Ustilago bromivora]|uniref:Uncharacterized protein n=1 Tax=Ustilago bromivora TaxID=307758 RepID=A0A8H8QN28_9BASI|nr:uncharacterized protein UBRO2_03069 [Ustilago bromivora]